MKPSTSPSIAATDRAWVRVALGVYVLAFLVGTGTHVDMLVHGWALAHHRLVNAYWTALTLIDPLVIILLLRFPRIGLLAALLTMVSDVGINSLVTYLYSDTAGHYAVDVFVQLQTAFLGFVLGSAPFLWGHFSRRRRSP